MSDPALRSSLHDALPAFWRAWFAYYAAEAFFTGIAPRLRHAVALVFRPETTLRTVPQELSLTFSVLVLLVYITVASALGLAATWLLNRRQPVRRAPIEWDTWATLSVIATVAANGVVARRIEVIPAVAVSLGALAVRWFGLRRHPGGDALTRVPGTWAVMWLLAGTAILVESRTSISTGLRLLSTAAYDALVVAGAMAGARLWRNPQPRPALRGASWAAAVVLVLTLPSWPSSAGSNGPGAAPASKSVDSPAVPSTTRPNIVLIVLDTVRADHTSAYGYPRDTTPFLRRFVGEGAALYPQAVSPSNHTLASHASLFTGLLPSRHGARTSIAATAGSSIAASVPTLPERLASAGYRTVGLVANDVFLDGGFGFARGFASYDCLRVPPFYRPTKPYFLRNAVRRGLLAAFHPDRGFAAFASGSELTRRAIGFLDGHSRDAQPFFLFLNYMDAHEPYQPVAPFNDRYPGRDRTFDWDTYPNLLDAVVMRRERDVTVRERDHLVSQYDASIVLLDREMERLVDTLRARKLLDDTLVVITSDHGECFGSRHAVGHAISLHEDETAVPLIVKWPVGSRVEPEGHVVSGLDLFPTLLEVAGLAVPEHLDGRSLVHGVGSHRLVVAESYAAGIPGLPASATRPTQAAAWYGGLKAIRSPGGRTEVFDPVTDPHELNDLSITERGRLDGAWEAILANLLADRPAAVRPTNPEAIDRLRSLGYVR